MREHMEPVGVRSTINIHLADEGRAWSQAYPGQGRAVVALETTAATVTVFASAENLERMSRVISDAQAALAAGSVVSAGLAGKAA
jgi:hypothetical protein